MKKQKILGVVLVLSLPIIFALFATSKVIVSGLNSNNYVPAAERQQMLTSTNTRSDTFGIEPVGGGLNLEERSSVEVVAGIIRISLSLLGIISIIFLTPLGIYFLVKKDYSMEQPQQPQPMQQPQGMPQQPQMQAQPQVALDPTMAHKYQGLTPEQIKYIRGGSLGAFFGGIIWPLGNKLWLWALLAFIPLVNIYVWLKLTFHGRRMAWEKAEWQSFDQFRQRQKVLGWIILGLFALYIILMIVSSLGQ